MYINHSENLQDVNVALGYAVCQIHLSVPVVELTASDNSCFTFSVP